MQLPEHDVDGGEEGGGAHQYHDGAQSAPFSVEEVGYSTPTTPPINSL